MLRTKYTQRPYLVTEPDRLFEEVGSKWLCRYGFSDFRTHLLFDDHIWADLVALPTRQQPDLLVLVYHYNTEKFPASSEARAVWGIANRAFFVTFCGWGEGLPEPLGVIEVEPLLELGQETVLLDQNNQVSARGILWEISVIRTSPYNPYPRAKNVLRQIKARGGKVRL